MTMTKTLMGFAVGASLLIGFAPAVVAAPVAAASISEASVSGDHFVKTTVKRKVERKAVRHSVKH
jgi:uncharacterized membrane protein (DUF485 family)